MEIDKQKLRTRLQQITGGLRGAPGSESGELRALQQGLAEQLAVNAEFTVFGHRLHHEGAEHLKVMTAERDEFTHLDQLFERSFRAETTATPAPLVFKRETDFHSNLLGNSVPTWGSGMAAAKSYGPFLDENGLKVWFDFYIPKRLVRVRLKGNSAPSLLIPLSGTVSAKKTYKIEAGSVWIASRLIAADSTLDGYFTGLKISGGTLELSSISEIDNGQIVIKPGASAIMDLGLKQNTLSTTSTEAGFDATEGVVDLPKKCSLKFDASGGKLKGDNASSTLFGCKTEFKFTTAPPTWFAGINHILVPYKVTSSESANDVFAIHSSKSGLSKFSGKAKIKDGSGWLLPAAKVDPAQLGEAAGVGALCVALLEGLSAKWKGLAGAETKLMLPAVMAEPGMLTVADFFSKNIYGKQKWTLWRNSNATHHSEITLSFGKVFPFVFVSASKGSEAIYFFCQHKASLDRPVDANGAPFKVESTIALAMILQDGKKFRAFLIDNDLLFDGDFTKKEAIKRCTVILRNALFHVSRPYSLFLAGTLKGDDQIVNGVLAMQFGIYLYLPTLPDPYVASYTLFLRDKLAIGFGNLNLSLASFVKWPNPDEENDHDNAYVYFKFSPLDQSLLLHTAAAEAASFEAEEPVVQPAGNDFQTGVRTFNRNVISEASLSRAALPLLKVEREVREEAPLVASHALTDKVSSIRVANEVEELRANPLLSHIKNKDRQIEEAFRLGTINAAQKREAESGANRMAMTSDPAAMMSSNRGVRIFPDAFRLLDVSSNADLMGVGFGGAFRADIDERGDANLRRTGVAMVGAAGAGGTLPLQIDNLDVVAVATYLRALTLPQISSEPIFNIPLEIEGPSALDDNI
ncbi:MAG TPA: hypothetical protein VJS64_02015, partial [Pyrinomonadaceae bacterium]|nr:hypothetical protein [Pyrinomonadaceae bacterium]